MHGAYEHGAEEQVVHQLRVEVVAELARVHGPLHGGQHGDTAWRDHRALVLGPQLGVALHLREHVVQEYGGTLGQAARTHGFQQEAEVCEAFGAGDGGVGGFDVAQDVDEELLLAAPATVDGGLADARGAGDALDGQAGEGFTGLQELHDGVEDRPLGGGAAGAAAAGFGVLAVVLGPVPALGVFSPVLCLVLCVVLCVVLCRLHVGHLSPRRTPLVVRRSS